MEEEVTPIPIKTSLKVIQETKPEQDHEESPQPLRHKLVYENGKGTAGLVVLLIKRKF